jgi:hypothetical protein
MASETQGREGRLGVSGVFLTLWWMTLEKVLRVGDVRR